MDNLTVKGIAINPEKVRHLDKDVTLDQLQKVLNKNGLDEVVFEQDGKAYVAWGRDMNLASFKNLKQGEVPTATYKGKPATVMLFDNEINSAKEGALKALDIAKDVAIGSGKFVFNQGITIITGGITLGSFAALAKVGTSAASFAAAKTLTITALQGLGKAGLWGIVIVGAAAAVGTGGMAVYGAVRKSDATGIMNITHD